MRFPLGVFRRNQSPLRVPGRSLPGQAFSGVNNMKNKPKKNRIKIPEQQIIKVKKKKNNALILCHDHNQFWTTQKQFWQWVREGLVKKTGDGPLTGQFTRRDEEKAVVIANTILNLGCPNHLREALAQRRLRG